MNMAYATSSFEFSRHSFHSRLVYSIQYILASLFPIDVIFCEPIVLASSKKGRQSLARIERGKSEIFALSKTEEEVRASGNDCRVYPANYFSRHFLKIKLKLNNEKG